MKSHFNKQGDQYILYTPLQKGDYSNYLINNEYYMNVTETLQGASKLLKPHFNKRNYLNGYKAFYIKEENDVWNVNQKQLPTPYQSYKLIHSLGYSELQTNRNDLDVKVRVFVPTKGMNEIWQIGIKNNKNTDRIISLFSIFDFEYAGVMEAKCTYDVDNDMIISTSFPYHVKYEEKNWVERNGYKTIYMFSDVTPDSYDCSKSNFIGYNTDHGVVPVAVEKDTCSNKTEEFNKTGGAMQHKLTLRSNEEKTITIVLGAALTKEQAVHRKNELLTTGIAVEAEKVEEFYNRQNSVFQINTPEIELNHLVNFWLKKQLYNMSVNNRLAGRFPIRNQLQDAMGYALIDPTFAFNVMKEVLSTQNLDGSIKQWQTYQGVGKGGLCLLDHSDGPVWLVITILSGIEQLGDIAYLSELVSYHETDQKDTIYNHLIKAIEYMSETVGSHGLCLMLDGDWTDPINGIGRKGRGESTWNTLATIFAINRMLPYAKELNEKDHQKLVNIKQTLSKAVREHCFENGYLIAGYDDDGNKFGDASKEEGSVYLNPQTWALMTDVFTEKEISSIYKIIDSLKTDVGHKLLDPSYQKWNDQVGRLSAKLAGTTENGSIYCHAELFKSFADCLNNRGDDAVFTQSGEQKP